jgi:DNA-binding transcriptional LysR family regulator
VDQLLCIRSFLRVADVRSFTKAAAELGVSRATVSTHVADLEQHLRCRLLQRSTRHVELTAAGAQYQERSRRILAELEGADEALRRTRPASQGG